MLIDRTKFLLLATTLAASSCTVVVENGDDTDVDTASNDTDEDAATGASPTDDMTTDELSDSGEPTNTTNQDGGDTGTRDIGTRDSGTTTAADAGELGADAGGALADGSVPREDASALDDSGSAADSGADSGMLVCLADEGSVPSCDDLAFSNLDSFQRAQCESASTIMKTGVAEQFVGCMLAQSSDELEDATNTYTCKLEAVLAACDDDNSQATCEAVQTWCPDEDLNECMDYVHGLTSAGRAEIVSCAEGGNCFSVYSCLEGL